MNQQTDDHRADVTGWDSIASARASWFDRLALAAKLRFSIIGNAVILGISALVFLGCLVYFATNVREIANFATIEVRMVHAALQLDDGYSALRDYRDLGQAERLDDVPTALASAEEHFEYIETFAESGLDPERVAQITALEDQVKGLEQRFVEMGPRPDAQELGAFAADIRSTRGS